jgi:hypothetical protein
MWTGWSIISFITAFCSCSLCIAVLSSRKARASVFNLYLAAFMMPDFVFSFSCFITCWMNANHGGYTGGVMCDWQSFYLIFGVTGSCWLNGVIAHEVFTLLSRTATLVPYHPPSRRVVLLQVLGVYVWAAIVASMTLWGVLPHQAFMIRGLLCTPMEYSQVSTLFFWGCFIPLSVGLPSLYAVGVLIVSRKRNLLNMQPNEDALKATEASAMKATETAVYRRRMRQARSISLYFSRIFLSLLICWAPAIITYWLLTPRSHWISFAGAAWGHLQGTISTIASFTKPDVRDAVVALFSCGRIVPKPAISPACEEAYTEESSNHADNAVYPLGPGFQGYHRPSSKPSIELWPSKASIKHLQTPPQS